MVANRMSAHARSAACALLRGSPVEALGIPLDEILDTARSRDDADARDRRSVQEPSRAMRRPMIIRHGL
jgi:hypothetical protein